MGARSKSWLLAAFEEWETKGKIPSLTTGQTEVRVKGDMVIAILRGEYGVDNFVGLSNIISSRWVPSNHVLVLDFRQVPRVEKDGARFFMNSLNISLQQGGMVYLVRAPKEIRRCIGGSWGNGNYRCLHSLDNLAVRKARAASTEAKGGVRPSGMGRRYPGQAHA